MSKKSSKKSIKTIKGDGKTSSKNGFDFLSNISERKFIIIASAVIVVLLFIFFRDAVFFGKTYTEAADPVEGEALWKSAREEFWNNHRYPLWSPYVFSGMPAYGSAIYVNTYPVNLLYNFLYKLIPFIKIPFFEPILHYFVAGLFFLLLMRHFKLGRWASLIGAIAFVFTPYLIGLQIIGHGAKIWVNAYIPVILLLTIKLFEKKSILKTALLGLCIGLQILAIHLQVIYYSWLLVGMYYMYDSIMRIYSKRKEIKVGVREALSNGIYLAIAFVIGIAISAVFLYSTYEYSHYSIRGGGASNTSTGTTGLSWNYATSWSFHPAEIITFLIPSFFGLQGYTYWGWMPFTQTTFYFGIFILLFSVLAMIYNRNRISIFFLIVAIFSLFVGFGNFLPILYAPMYKFLPYFNKFRVPSMAYILLCFSICAVATFGLHSLFTLDFKSKQLKNITQKVVIGLLIILGLAILITIIAKPLYPSIAKFSKVGELEKYGAQTFQYLKAERIKMALNDTYMMMFMLLVGIGLILAQIYRVLPSVIIKVLLIIFVLIDLWVVNLKFVKPRDAKIIQSALDKNESIKFLEERENDKNSYRVFPLGDLMDTNKWGYYYISTIQGYHAAKLKIYQDMRENVFFPDNRSLNFNAISMLNGKYLIAEDQFAQYLMMFPFLKLVYDGQREKVFLNTRALPRAYLVDSVEVITNREKIFARLNSPDFDPSKFAILEKQPNFTLESKEGSTVKITSFDIHKITLDVSVAKPCLLVSSEIYYPKGWKAFVNGQEREIYKTNYVLRSIYLKPGDTKVEFIFDPASFKYGLLVSVCSLISVIGIIVISAIKKW